MKKIALCLGLVLCGTQNAHASNVVFGNTYVELDQGGSLAADTTATIQYTLTGTNLSNFYAADSLTSTGANISNAYSYTYSPDGSNTTSGSNNPLLSASIQISGDTVDFVYTNLMASAANFQNDINFNGALSSISQGTVVSTASVSAVPLPPTAPLFGAALLGLVGYGYSRKKNT
jgi:hypothetical protein